MNSDSIKTVFDSLFGNIKYDVREAEDTMKERGATLPEKTRNNRSA